MDPKQLINSIKNLGYKRKIIFKNNELKLACLIRQEDRRPFQADWWKGKQSSLIAVDDNGHFYLHHCGGYILKVDPVSKEEETISKSEGEFLSMISLDD